MLSNRLKPKILLAVHGNREVPDAHCCAIERGLPLSAATASGRVDFRLPAFGLTLPPEAVAPLPDANKRKPSFLILIAALISLSCRCWQWGQSNERTERSIFGIGSSVTLQR
jgi:hypothetical protein